jgi:hypothetical protein
MCYEKNYKGFMFFSFQKDDIINTNCKLSASKKLQFVLGKRRLVGPTSSI